LYGLIVLFLFHSVKRFEAGSREVFIVEIYQRFRVRGISAS
jgi:hypothetical protein